MKICIRTVPERDIEYLKKHLPMAEVHTDYEHKGCIASFIDAMIEMEDDCIFIQDDVFLCQDFAEKAMQIINSHKNDVVVFCNMTDDKMCRKVTKTGYYKAREGFWQYCTYIPKEMQDLFFVWFASPNRPKINNYNRIIKYDMDDALFARFLDSINKKVFVVVPNLAGHNYEEESVVNPNRPKRKTHNFDYERKAK